MKFFDNKYFRGIYPVLMGVICMGAPIVGSVMVFAYFIFWALWMHNS